MSYMERIEAEILEQLDLLADGSTDRASVAGWVKTELLSSFKQGIATAMRNPRRQATSEDARPAVAAR